MINNLSIDLATYRIKKAKSLIIQSELLNDNNQYDGSINRSYYAIFNAMRSLLALVDLDSAKHSGILSFFDKYFIKTDILDKEFSKIAHSAFDTRQDNDYEDFYEPTEEESKNQLNNAKRFVTKIEAVLGNMIEKKIELPQINGQEIKGTI